MYICTTLNEKTTKKSRGFLAQLVQSIWFTPRGSGFESLRTHRKGNETFKKIRVLSSVGSEHLVYTQRVGVRIPQDPQKGNETFKKIRVLSSVGSEHLVYTQRVRGSNPLGPTKISQILGDFFIIFCNLFHLSCQHIQFIEIKIPYIRIS